MFILYTIVDKCNHCSPVNTSSIADGIFNSLNKVFIYLFNSFALTFQASRKKTWKLENWAINFFNTEPQAQAKCHLEPCEGGRWVNFQFPPWGRYGCFLEWPITVTPKSLENHRKKQEVGLLCSLFCGHIFIHFAFLKFSHTLGGGLVSYFVPDKANKGASCTNLQKYKKILLLKIY
jgi:hypothetical protein